MSYLRVSGIYVKKPGVPSSYEYRGLLVWDSASTQRARGMNIVPAERNIIQIMIPVGYLQTLDNAINKPFKNNLWIEIIE